MGNFRSDLPIGTSDAEVFLSGNVPNLDEAMNSDQPEWFNRFGIKSLTYKGMLDRFDNSLASQEQRFVSQLADQQGEFNDFIDESGDEFRQFLASSGYSGADRPYAAGIVLNAHNEGFVRCEPDSSACLFYTPRGDTPLPYTTTGNWATESSLFVVRGDDSLRQDLADPDKGPDMIFLQQDFIGAAVRSLREKNSDFVTLKDAGAVGDGVADDTLAIAAAAEFSRQTGKLVTVTSGRYKMTDTVDMSNTRFLSNDSVIFDGSTSTKTSMFTVTGSAGPEINTSANVTRGDNVIQTETHHGLSVGDWFLIISQRACSHPDAGPDWQLGSITANASHVYFAEPLQVEAVESPNSVRTTTALIFPDYRTDNTQETYQGPRTRTTIKKINFATVSFLGNPTIITPKVYGQAFNMAWTFEHKIHANFVFDKNPGGAIYYKYAHSGKCVATADRDINWTLEEDHSRYNSFRDVSSWYSECEINGERHGSQCYDQTYADICSIMPKVKIRAYDSHEQGCTTHGNTYGVNIEAEVYNHRRSGISNRARFAKIKAITRGVPGLDTSYGITLSEWGQQNLELDLDSTNNSYAIQFDKSSSSITDSPESVIANATGRVTTPKSGAFVFRRRTNSPIAPNIINLKNWVFDRVPRALHVDASVTHWNGINIDGVSGTGAVNSGKTDAYFQFGANSAFHSLKNISLENVSSPKLVYIPRISDTGLSNASGRQSVDIDWSTVNVKGFSGVWADGYLGVLSVTNLQDVITRGLFNRPVVATANNTVNNRTITLTAGGSFSGIPVGGYVELLIAGSGLPIVTPEPGATVVGSADGIAFGKTLRILRRTTSGYIIQVF